MAGFSGSYTHAAGDRFIFKGGVTWPMSAQWTINDSGNSGAQDYYGVDVTWFTGGSFTLPVFDFQNVSVGGWGISNSGMRLGGSWMVFDHLNWKRHRSDLNYGSFTVATYGADKITFQDCVIQDWTGNVPANSGTSLGNKGGGLGNFYDAGGGGITVIRCTFHQVSAPTQNGIAIFQVPNCLSNEVYHTSTSYHGGGTISYNHFHDLTDCTDFSAHTDAIIFFSPSVVDGNRIHGMSTAHAPIEMCPGRGSSITGTTLVINNVVYDAGGQNPCWGKSDNTNVLGHTFRIYNNTFQSSGNNTCVMFEKGGSGHFGTVDCRNNNFITDALQPFASQNTITDPNYETIDSLTLANNTLFTHSAATSFGYTSANGYAPTSSSSPTVGVGLDLSAFFTDSINGVTRSVPWDTGAYQFASTPGSPGVVQFTVAGQTVSESAGTVTITVARGTGTTGAISATCSTASGTATAGVNFTATTQTLNWAGGDGVSKSFTVPIANTSMVGSKQFTVSITATTGGASIGSPSVETVTLNGTGTPPPTVLPGTAWQAEAGTISAPMTTATGGGRTWVYDPLDGSGPNDAARVTFTFNLPADGVYKIGAVVSTSSQNNNSVYIGFETDTLAEPTTIWDMIVTGAGTWTKTYASWRGNGSNISPQFPLKTWTLTAGQHTITIVAREANTLIDSVSVESAAPVVGVSVSAISGAGGQFKVGGVVPITVTWSQPVTVAGTPLIALNTGASASYVSGSGTTNTVFNYIVAGGQNTQALDYTATNALTLNGGTIQDGLGNAVDRTLPLPGAGSSLSASRIVIDTIMPTVSISAPNGTWLTPPVVYTVTYTDVNFALTSLTNSDVTLNKTGTANAVVATSNNGTNQAYISISGFTGAGTLGVTVAAGTGRDYALNLAPGVGPSQTFWEGPSTATPVNASPADGTVGVTLTPTLTASAFSDIAGFSFTAAQWVIYAPNGTTIVYDSGAVAGSNSFTVPGGPLGTSSAYLWSVRYKNSGGSWSQYSSKTGFSTLGPVNNPAVITIINPGSITITGGTVVTNHP